VIRLPTCLLCLAGSAKQLRCPASDQVIAGLHAWLPTVSSLHAGERRRVVSTGAPSRGSGQMIKHDDDRRHAGPLNITQGSHSRLYASIAFQQTAARLITHFLASHSTTVMN